MPYSIYWSPLWFYLCNSTN